MYAVVTLYRNSTPQVSIWPSWALAIDSYTRRADIGVATYLYGSNSEIIRCKINDRIAAINPGRW
jgi:hypothetical protein